MMIGYLISAVFSQCDDASKWKRWIVALTDGSSTEILQRNDRSKALNENACLLFLKSENLEDPAILNSSPWTVESSDTFLHK